VRGFDHSKSDRTQQGAGPIVEAIRGGSQKKEGELALVVAIL